MTPDRWRQVEDLCHAALRVPCRGARGVSRGGLCGRRSAAARGRVAARAGIQRRRVHERAGGGARRDQPCSISRERTLVGAALRRRTRSARCSAPAAWARSTARTTTTLGRDVAIKVLPPAFTADPDRLARFEREARMLAALNHPHIGAIYGVEEADGVRGL